MMKELENFEQLSKFEQDLINLILKANEENLEKLRKAYPELVEKFGKKKKMTLKSWLKNNWTEAILVSGLLLGVYVLYKSMGIIT